MKYLLEISIDPTVILLFGVLALALSLWAMYEIIKAGVRHANKDLLRSNRILIHLIANKMKKEGMESEVENAGNSVNEIDTFLGNNGDMSKEDIDKKKAEYLI